MDIIDFLPKYPNIDNTKYEILNPYNEDFYEAIFHKKEFYENKLDRVEIFPKERGMLTRYQKTITRYLSSNTPYDRLLLVHSMGLGKGCSAIGSIEQIKGEESTFTGALILAKGEGLLGNFMNEIVEKCTPGYYIPENYSKLTELEKTHRIKKKLKYYQFKTFAKFAKNLSKMSDGNITENYSNKIIIIDEVHNLRPQKEDKGTLEIYNQFHRMLHLITNSKVLFLSGTPMKDGPEEIADVANLFLSLDKQLPTGEEFLSEFMFEKEGVYYINLEKQNILKELLKGKISFLREPESNIKKEFIGEKNFGKLKHFIVSPNTMSSFQSKYYEKAYKEDKNGKTGVYINSREASLFVYPNGSYGIEGFKKYIIEVKAKKFTKDKKEVTSAGSYKLSDELEEILRGDNNNETLENIKKYSCTYAYVIENILNTPGNCFVYSSLVQGSGCILFSLLLELFNFSKAKGREKDPRPRYAILTNKTTTTRDIKRISSRFNKKDNIHGEYIKVIIGSRAISEGYSFRNVIFESINTPHWNYSETAQALSRGIRLGSHNDLISEGEEPVIKIIQPVAMSKNKLSIDLLMYETSEIKDIGIRSVLRLLMENAFDCALNYVRNFVDGVNNSRDCDYTKCKYSCDGIDMSEVKKGIDEKDLDYSTYQLYYANPKTPIIRGKIEQLFREKRKIDTESIIKNLNTQFTEEEIKNALFLIQEESESDILDYRTFLNIYSRTPVKKIMNKIEEMFKINFKLSYESIIQTFHDYTEFEVLSALQTIINDNVILINKYGLSCYLREENNIYFLVNSLSVIPNFNIEYYTEYPHISVDRNFVDIMNRIYSLSLPDLINKIFETENIKDFTKIVKTLPPVVQEMLIEASIVSQEKEITKNKDTRDKIINFFANYIKNIDNMYISTFLKNILRCYKSGGGIEDWKVCKENYGKYLQEYELNKQQKLRENNKYGIIGKYNPENDSFCIADFKREKESREKVAGKSKGVDKRISYSGKVCGAGGWKLDELVEIAIVRLKINFPKDYREDQDDDTLIDLIKSDPRLSKFLKPDMSSKDLRRILYWGAPKKEGGNRGIKTICNAIRKWFEKHNLMEIDNQCGIQGKKKETESKKENKKSFRIETYSAKDEKFKIHLKDITKLMEECFGSKKFKPSLDDSKWIMVFLRKKLVGFVTIDNNNILWNVCVAKNYRRQGIAKEAMIQATNYACSIRDKKPQLIVNNSDKDAKKLIRMYNNFGFEIFKSDDKYTYMANGCK